MEPIWLSLLQLAVAIILSAIAAFLALSVFQWMTRGVDEWEALRQGNAAIGIVLGAIVVAAAIVLRPALAVDSSAWDAGSGHFLGVLLAEALQLLLGLVFTVVTLSLSLALFAALTRGIDEMQELIKGNLALAGLLAGVIIGVALMVGHALEQVMVRITSLLF